MNKVPKPGHYKMLTPSHGFGRLIGHLASVHALVTGARALLKQLEPTRPEGDDDLSHVQMFLEKAEGEFEPLLALAWEINPDPKKPPGLVNTSQAIDRPCADSPNPKGAAAGFSEDEILDRQMVALEASWELEEILQAIRTGYPMSGDSAKPLLATRCLSLRALTLNSVMMTVLDGSNDLEPTAVLRERVSGNFDRED